MSHTPGPWDQWKHVRDGSLNVVNAASDFVCEVGVLGKDGDDRDARIIADARLIAAAPDLLAHAELDLAELEYYVGNPSAWDAYDDAMSERLRAVIERARAAIKKATSQ